ncbi:MAG TPA: sensor histidine kinase [Rhodocyclaceae bacterium]|nr:sensor histidine kinase [Rhodocyclaceae bacterium]
MKSPPEESPPSIKRRLLWLLLASLGTVMAINIWVNFLTADRPIHAAFDHALYDDAYAVSAHIETGPDGIRCDIPPGAEQALRTDPDDVVFFLVVGPRGEYLCGDRDLPVPPVASAEPGGTFDALYRGEPVRGVSQEHATPLGTVTIHVAQTLRARHRLGIEVASGLLISNGLLMLIALAFVYLGVGRGLRPLLRVSADIDARRPDRLDPISTAGLPAELLPLALAVNHLLQVLRDSSVAQRVFLAEAAHQLRTPLTGLQGQLELLADETLSQGQRGRVLDLLDATRRLAHLSERLLALARSDARANPVKDMARIDLAEIVADCVAPSLDRALAKQIDIGFETEAAPVVGSAWMLREMASNLIDNAITYTPEGGRITVRTGLADGRALLEVEDNGPGIPAAERERVFERFFRGSGASASGCGLGLAIVKEIADAHGAAVSVGSADGGRGTLVRATFPPPAAPTTNA